MVCAGYPTAWPRVALTVRTTLPCGLWVGLFLLEDPQRLPWVTGYLNAQGQNRCARFDHKGYLERTYPGGIAGLEQAWGNWLAKGETALLTF